MPVNSPEELMQALANGRDGEIEGTEESDWCDFKSQPYQLDDDFYRWELAKDVAALANGQGGVILIAARTVKPDHLDEEVAEEVVAVPVDMLDRKRHRDIIRQLTYPPLSDRVDLRLYERGGGKSLLVIRVDQAADDQWPVLVIRRFTDAGRSVSSFAVARRTGAHTEWLPEGVIHRDISDGRMSRRTRLGLEALPLATEEEDFDERLDRVMEYAGWENLAAYLLVAVPPRGKRIEDLYSHEGVRGTLETLGRYGVRASGFGLGYGIEVHTEGTSLVTTDRDRIVWVDRDGFLICGIAGTTEFLGWAQERYSRARVGDTPAIRVNRIVLVEYTYEFCRFVGQELMDRLGPDGWQLVSVGRRMRTGDAPVVLPDRNGPVADLKQAVLDDWEEPVQATGDPGRDAFSLLARTFEMFGLSAETIPYTEEGRVSEEEIMAIS